MIFRDIIKCVDCSEKKTKATLNNASGKWLSTIKKNHLLTKKYFFLNLEPMSQI